MKLTLNEKISDDQNEPCTFCSKHSTNWPLNSVCVILYGFYIVEKITVPKNVSIERPFIAIKTFFLMTNNKQPKLGFLKGEMFLSNLKLKLLHDVNRSLKDGYLETLKASSKRKISRKAKVTLLNSFLVDSYEIKAKRDLISLY